jgi:hypothetical protein
MRRTGRLHTIREPAGSGHISKQTGYKLIRIDGKLLLEHKHIAEQVLGRPLRNAEEVHHIDENKTNNEKSNLLICTRDYHRELHRRLEAYKACSNPDWRKCCRCGEYDDIKNMYEYIPKRNPKSRMYNHPMQNNKCKR